MYVCLARFRVCMCVYVCVFVNMCVRVRAGRSNSVFECVIYSCFLLHNGEDAVESERARTI